MIIRSDLVSVRSVVNNFGRKYSATPGFSTDEVPKEFGELCTDTQCVWCVGEAAFVASRITVDTTAIEFVPVKGIFDDDGKALSTWLLLKDEFKAFGLFASDSNEDELEIYNLKKLERVKLGRPRPELEDENRWKDKKRAEYRAKPYFDSGFPEWKRIRLYKSDINEMVEREWDAHRRSVQWQQERYDKPRRLKPLSVEEATRRYFADLDARGDPAAGKQTEKQAAASAAQAPAKTEIISMNQRGGITAHSVIIQRGISQTTIAAGQALKERKLIWRILAIVSAIIAFLAALVKILEYFRISPF